MRCRARGDLQGAVTVARAALEGWRRNAGDASLEVAQARVTLAGFLSADRSFTEAEPLLQAGLPVVREHFGGDIVHTLPSELQLVSLLRRMSRPAESGDRAAAHPGFGARQVRRGERPHRQDGSSARAHACSSRGGSRGGRTRRPSCGGCARAKFRQWRLQHRGCRRTRCIA